MKCQVLNHRSNCNNNHVAFEVTTRIITFLDDIPSVWNICSSVSEEITASLFRIEEILAT
jgi:hypothetical protein